MKCPITKRRCRPILGVSGRLLLCKSGSRPVDGKSAFRSLVASRVAHPHAGGRGDGHQAARSANRATSPNFRERRFPESIRLLDGRAVINRQKGTATLMEDRFGVSLVCTTRRHVEPPDLLLGVSSRGKDLTSMPIAPSTLPTNRFPPGKNKADPRSRRFAERRHCNQSQQEPWCTAM